MITHKAIAGRLRQHGVNISKEAVGDYRNGKWGSKYAADIDRVERELAAEILQQIESKHGKDKTKGGRPANAAPAAQS